MEPAAEYVPSVAKRLRIRVMWRTTGKRTQQFAMVIVIGDVEDVVPASFARTRRAAASLGDDDSDDDGYRKRIILLHYLC